MKSPVRLLWITPPDGDLDRVEELLAERRQVPGLALLLRRPNIDDRRVVREARRLVPYDVPLLMQRADLALAVGAAGVHLPERGLDPEDARGLCADWIVGVSRHDREGLHASGSASYATLAPFGVVDGKNQPLGVDGYRRALQGVAIPTLALGGIDASSATLALAAGASGVAFIRAGLSRREFDALVKALDSPAHLG